MSVKYEKNEVKKEKKEKGILGVILLLFEKLNIEKL